MRLPAGLAGFGLIAATALLVPASRAEVQLRCDGTLLEARGQAEQKRPIRDLGLSLGLEAQGPSSDAALASLQGRLAQVRTALQSLEVRELQVSSPSTWTRQDRPGRADAVVANLQVSGRVLPQRLQSLIRSVGALPGVRLAPVTTVADPRDDNSVRRALLEAAYQDAQRQASEVAAAIGLRQLRPLEVQLDGGEMRPPIMMRAMAAPTPPPFDPNELTPPSDRLSLLARFCAR
jgi:uncharacterized protein YggE